MQDDLSTANRLTRVCTNDDSTDVGGGLLWEGAQRAGKWAALVGSKQERHCQRKNEGLSPESDRIYQTPLELLQRARQKRTNVGATFIADKLDQYWSKL